MSSSHNFLPFLLSLHAFFLLAYGSAAAAQTVILSAELPLYSATADGNNIQSMGAAQKVLVTNSTSGVAISVSKGSYYHWTTNPASAVQRGYINGGSTNAFYNGGCLAYNVTSSSISKQLYVGVYELYADITADPVPGSLCADECQKLIALDPKGAYILYIRDNSTTGNHAVNISYNFYQPDDPVCSLARGPYQAVPSDQTAGFPFMAIGSIDNTNHIYGADTINYLAVFSNISCLSWGISVNEGTTSGSSNDVFLTLLDQLTLFEALRTNTVPSVSQSPSATLCRAEPDAFTPCALSAEQYPTASGLTSSSTYYLLLTNFNTQRSIEVVYSPRNGASCPTPTSPPAANAFVTSSPSAPEGSGSDPACGTSSIIQNADDSSTLDTIGSICG